MSFQSSATSAPASASISHRRHPLAQAIAVSAEEAATQTSSSDSDLFRRVEALCRALQLGPNLDQAIRLPELLAIVGVSKSTWYARLNANSPSYDPRAPKPFKLGASERSPSVWWRSAVMAYVTACADAQVER